MNFGKILIKITEKWPAKVLSLAAALLISIFYRLNTLETRDIIVPLKSEVTANLIPVNSITNTVRVTLRGESNNILTLTEDDIEAFIDLKRYEKEGTFRVPIQIRKTGNALGVEPLEISVSPAEIYVTLEEKVSRSVHVFPVFSGNTAAGFTITSQSISPESVIAEGPVSSLDSLREFSTETIDLEGRNAGFTIYVPIKNENPNITIYGNRLIEFSCTINRIDRSTPVFIRETLEENGETAE